MNTDNLVVLGVALLLVALLCSAAYVTRRRNAPPGSGQGARSGLHPGLAAGLSAVLAEQPELAIEHLRTLVHEDSEAIEVYILLGDLYRRVGQVERALRIHRSVLERTGLDRAQRVTALSSLARDHEAAGFLDRALGAFAEVANLAPKSVRPLRHLRRLNERAGAWKEALAVQKKILSRVPDAAKEKEKKTLAFLQERVGRSHEETGDLKAARKSYEEAIRTHPSCVPAILHLGDLHLNNGKPKEAQRAWLRLLENDKSRAWHALPRLEDLHRRTADLDGLQSILQDLIRESPRDWRVGARLAQLLSDKGQHEEARLQLAQSMRHSPSSPTLQRIAWMLAIHDGLAPEVAHANVEALGRDRSPTDPHSCLHCRYRTDSAAWRCPHCHRWDSFVPDH